MALVPTNKFSTARPSSKPNIVLGHKFCRLNHKVVPRHAGWLWKKHIAEFGRGWKPGAIYKPIWKIMKIFSSERQTPEEVHGKARNICCNLIEKKPTLKVCKKKGVYYITLRPIKKIEGINEFCPDPYQNFKAIQFKIAKCPILIIEREIKKLLKICGFKKCTCHLPVMFCVCREEEEKADLHCKIKHYCSEKEIPNIIDTLILTDTSESESDLDFEYTAPIESHKFVRRTKTSVKQTQYMLSDIKIQQPQVKTYKWQKDPNVFKKPKRNVVKK